MLFIIVMEFFSVIMTACTRTTLIPTLYVQGDFSVSHLMFIDDLIVFSKANPIATYNHRNFLEHFRRFSRLLVSRSKSSIFFSDFWEYEKQIISAIINIREENLPV